MTSSVVTSPSPPPLTEMRALGHRGIIQSARNEIGLYLHFSLSCLCTACSIISKNYSNKNDHHRHKKTTTMTLQLFVKCHLHAGLPWWLSGKRICLPVQETQVQSPGRDDPLQQKMAIHSSMVAGKSHGQRSLTGYSLWCYKGSDSIQQWNNDYYYMPGIMISALHIHFHLILLQYK